MLTISYDGSRYVGWQIQKKGLSIQGEIQKALKILLKEEIGLFGAGRTDASANALNQTASFKTSAPIKHLKKFIYSLNGILKKDIRIKKIERMENSFHARYSATSKSYLYFVSLSEDPFIGRYCYHLKKRIDIDLLKKASLLFIGKHDFTSFSNRGSSVKNMIREIKRFDIKVKKDLITFEIEGSGFLYKMVRNIIGTLLEVASGKIDIQEIEEIFKAKNRKKAKKALPAHALFLKEVHYVENLSKNSKKLLKNNTPLFTNIQSLF